jgi:histidinol dehydrogenase
VLVLKGQLDLRTVDELAAVTEVNVLLDDLADPKVPDRLAADLIASAAASSQEVVLVRTTPITR